MIAQSLLSSVSQIKSDGSKVGTRIALLQIVMAKNVVYTLI